MTLNPAGLGAHRDHQENAERSSPLKPCKSHAAGATVPLSPRSRVQASFQWTVTCSTDLSSWVSPFPPEGSSSLRPGCLRHTDLMTHALNRQGPLRWRGQVREGATESLTLLPSNSGGDLLSNEAAGDRSARSQGPAGLPRRPRDWLGDAPAPPAFPWASCSVHTFLYSISFFSN